MALRDQFLGHFAHICHLGPREVDGLRMSDFAKLVLFIEQVLKHNSQSGG